MGFSAEDLIQIRPFAFHTSSRRNFEAIQSSRLLRSAYDLIWGTDYDYLLSGPRKESSVVRLCEGEIEIRDHRPLRLGSVRFEPGCSVSDFIRELNSRVFLWAGNASGPVHKSGKSHYERYAAEGEVFVLRVPLQSLLVRNPNRQLFVTRCNSGSARHQGGKPLVRGPSTFVLPEEARFTATQVVELSFTGVCCLPDDTQWSVTVHGPWQPLGQPDLV